MGVGGIFMFFFKRKNIPEKLKSKIKSKTLISSYPKSKSSGTKGVIKTVIIRAGLKKLFKGFNCWEGTFGEEF